MDALWTKKANELAKELASQATTIEDLNGAMRSLMKTAIETMLNSEMSVHLGCGRAAVVAEAGRAEKTVIEAVSEGA
jgi:transposase-like protein